MQGRIIREPQDKAMAGYSLAELRIYDRVGSGKITNHVCIRTKKWRKYHNSYKRNGSLW